MRFWLQFYESYAVDGPIIKGRTVDDNGRSIRYLSIIEKGLEMKSYLVQSRYLAKSRHFFERLCLSLFVCYEVK
jgi:hypothetical protein